MLRSDLYDYSVVYFIVTGRTSVTGTNNGNRRNETLTFTRNALFRSCISNINNIFIYNAEDLDIVVPMYNLLEYSNNYFLTLEILWSYYNDFANENNDAINFRTNNNKRTASKFFECKTKITGSTQNNDYRLDGEVFVLLKYLSKFWKYLDLPLINCKIELGLSWSSYNVISEILILRALGFLSVVFSGGVSI